MLIEVAASLLLARCFFFSSGFGPAMKQAVGSSLAPSELPLDLLARFSKIDDVTHFVPSVLAR
jgi:hypothetical protein